MFVHAKNTWIGGHQQPLGMRSAVINFGPGDVEWIIISPDDIPLLEKKFRETYDAEMHRNEGLWYINTDLLAANNIPFYTAVQREGDMMLLGPGVLSMRKCLDLSYQISWCFGTKDYPQLYEGFKKVKNNTRCALTDPIAFYTLVLDSVNYDISSYGTSELELIHQEFKDKLDDENTTLDEFLRLFYIKEKDNTDLQSRRKLFKHQPETANMLFCTRCNQEIFNNWIVLPLIEEGGPHYN